MKKIFVVIMTVALMLLSGCSYEGYDWYDTNYHFDYAYIKLPNGLTVEGDVVSWADSEDGEQLTITLDNGHRYLVSSYNCVLIEDL